MYLQPLICIQRRSLQVSVLIDLQTIRFLWFYSFYITKYLIFNISCNCLIAVPIEIIGLKLLRLCSNLAQDQFQIWTRSYLPQVPRSGSDIGEHPLFICWINRNLISRSSLVLGSAEIGATLVIGFDRRYDIFQHTRHLI